MKILRRYISQSFVSFSTLLPSAVLLQFETLFYLSGCVHVHDCRSNVRQHQKSQRGRTVNNTKDLCFSNIHLPSNNCKRNFRYTETGLRLMTIYARSLVSSREADVRTVRASCVTLIWPDSADYRTSLISKYLF